jgi:hypothetical protein
MGGVTRDARLRALAFLALVSCGESSPATPADAHVEEADREAGDARLDANDGGDGAKDAPYPAPHAAPPQATSAGGPIDKEPEVIPVFFQGDDLEARIESFLTMMAASDYWPAATSEYGVGSLTIGSSIVVAATAPMSTTDAEIQAFLAGHLGGSDPTWPSVTANRIYTVFYPEQTTITIPMLGTSCVGFGGYHENATVTLERDGGALEAGLDAGLEAATLEAGPLDAGQARFTYAVIPRCAMFAGYSGIDAVTSAVSHETVEASTDPLVGTNSAYDGVDENHAVWDLEPGGEIADLCSYEPQSYQRLVGSFLVQRVWSNHAASAGHDPCVPPVPESSAYYNAAPDLTADVELTYDKIPFATQGVHIPVGSTVTVPLRFFSDSPTGAWTVYLEDSSSAFGGPSLLEFSPNRIVGQNGDVVPVKVKAVQTGPYGGTEMILVSYRPPDEATLNYWFGFVQN